MPARTSSGIGTDDGLDVSTSGRCLWIARIAWITRVDGARWITRLRPVVARSGVGASGDELASERALQRPRDDVLGVRVVADVVGDRVDRLLVAVQRVEAVDAAVVEPVVEHLLSARGRSGGRARGRQGRQQRRRDDERRDECAEWADFVDETSFHRGSRERGLGGVSRLGVIQP